MNALFFEMFFLILLLMGVIGLGMFVCYHMGRYDEREELALRKKELDRKQNSEKPKKINFINL